MLKISLVIALLFVFGFSGCSTGSEPITGSVNSQSIEAPEIQMALIPSGNFTMGLTKPTKMNFTHPAHQHEVTLTQPFYLSIYEVTNEQYNQVMGKPAGNGEASPPDAPIHTITWEQAIKFCEKLTELPASKAEGKIYRLPTEAEWEYACRAGSTTDYYFGDSKEKLGEYTWHMDNIRDGKTAPNARSVGQKKPNAWGLYDMHGNVNEFCQDIFGPYAAEAVVDPKGPKDGYSRVVRGGAWGSPAENCLSAYREEMSGASNSTGFRVALSVANQIALVKSVHQVPLADFDQSSKLDHQPHGGPLLETRTLDYAALRESFLRIDAMLANGADPNAKSVGGTPILFYAIEDAKQEILDVRSNWNMEDQSRAFSKQPKIERNAPVPTRLLTLLKAGADPNARDEKGRSPLNYAIEAGELTTVALLYQFGAGPALADATGLTPIDLSAKRHPGADVAAYGFLKLPHPSPQVGKRPEPPLLLRQPDQQLGSTLFRPASGGVALTYSGDGKHVISGQSEHVLQVFDATTGARVSVIHTSFDYCSNHYIWSLTSIPNSRIVIAGGSIGYPLRFWNIDTGIEVMRLECKCVQASVSPDGKFLFTGDYLCQIKSIEPLKLGATAREFRGSADQKIQVRSSFFTPDSRYLVFVDDESVRVWELASDTVIPIQGIAPEIPRPITWGDIGKLFKIDPAHRPAEIIALPGNSIGFQTVTAKTASAVQPFLKQNANSMIRQVSALSPDGTSLAVLGRASRIDVYDLATQRKKITYTGHTDALLAVAVSTDGQLIASGGADQQVIVWDVRTGTLKRGLPINAVVRSICFSPDNRHLAIGDQSGNIHWHELATGKTQTWKSQGDITDLKVDVARNALISLGDNIEMRDMKSGTIWTSVPAGTAKNGRLAYAEKGMTEKGLILGSFIPQDIDSKVRNAWSIVGDKLVAQPMVYGAPANESTADLTAKAVAISPDGKLAATSTRWHSIRLWDLEKHEPIGNATGNLLGSMYNINDLEFSPDGQTIAAGCADGTARVWDIATGRQLLVLNADVHNVAAIAFQPKGQLVTANADGTVHVWNLPQHLD